MCICSNPGPSEDRELKFGTLSIYTTNMQLLYIIYMVKVSSKVLKKVLNKKYVFNDAY